MSYSKRHYWGLRSGLSSLVTLWVLLIATAVFATPPLADSAERNAGAKQDGEKPKEGEKKEKEDGEGQEEEKKEGEAGKKATAEPVKKKRPSGFTVDEEKAVLALFHATKKEFTEEGLLRLVYDYSTENENLLLDWKPDIATTKRRIRWAVRNDTGLMIAETGTHVHQAVWLDRFSMQVKGTSYAQMNRGAYRVAGIFDSKLKRVLGTNVGDQIVRLNGMKVTAGMPRKFPKTAVEQKLDFGFELKDGIFRSKRGKAKLHDTSKKPSWTKKLVTGRMGLRWSGRTQMCLHEITLEGRIDPKWLKKSLR